MIRVEEAMIRLLFFPESGHKPSNRRQIRMALRKNMNIGGGIFPKLRPSVPQKSWNRYSPKEIRLDPTVRAYCYRHTLQYALVT